MSYELWVPGEIWTLNSARRKHHMAQAALVKPMRHSAHMLALNAIRNGDLVKFDGPVRVTFEPHQINRGPAADTVAHAPACKAALDGLVDAGVVPDDTPEWVVSQTFLPPIRVPANATGVRVVVDAVT